MGLHYYPCPTCYATQKVRAQSGEIVEIKDCEACAQAKDKLFSGEATQADLAYLAGPERKRR